MYSQEVADAVCARLAAGESLRSAAKAEGVAPTTVLFWRDERADFADQYASARARGYLLLADELVEIADESGNDTFIDDNGNQRTNTEVVARSRLRIDTRKWMLSKMLPKVYGDKLSAELTGKDGAPLFEGAVREIIRPE